MKVLWFVSSSSLGVTQVFIMGNNTLITTILENGANQQPIMVDMLVFLKKTTYVHVLNSIVIV